MPTKTLILRTKDGYLLEAFVGDSITQTLQRDGLYDANTLVAIRDVIRLLKPKVTLDIGANIGNHALVLSEHSEQVIAFEPVKQVFVVLQNNIQRNHKSHIQAFQVALSNSDGKQTIFLNAANIGSSSLNAFSAASERQIITTVIGDDFLQQLNIEQIDFIKIDVEGYEGQVIEGLQSLIRTSRPIILMESRNESTQKYFDETKLFENLFQQYSFYALGHSASKKSMSRGICNRLKRLKNRIFGGKWGLYPFSAERKYSNVFAIPNEQITLLSKKIN